MDDEKNDRRWYDYTRAGETAAAFAGFIESMAQSDFALRRWGFRRTKL